MDERIAVLLGLPIFFALSQVLMHYLKKMKWTCRIGWHDGDGEKPHFKEGDVFAVNLTSTCSKCGQSVMQDSQGNWF
jgi:hypothetical protein